MTNTPASPNQPEKDRDIRGYDYASTLTGDEYVKAVAYNEHLKAMDRSREAYLALLAGNPQRARQLRQKTLALTRSAPAHVEGG